MVINLLKSYYKCVSWNTCTRDVNVVMVLFLIYSEAWEYSPSVICSMPFLCGGKTRTLVGPKFYIYVISATGESPFWHFFLVSAPTEKAMAPHSSTLAWKILWTEEPGRLQSMGSLRVGHHWATSLSLFTFMHWRRKWQPTPVFLPGESRGQGSLVGFCLWGLTELDMTEAT